MSSLTDVAWRRAVRFRPGAFLLLLLPLPILALWLLEGGIELYLLGSGPGAGAPAITAAHRISGWLVPPVLGAVFGYGIARTEPDVRLAVMGRHDPRRVWALRWLPMVTLFCGAAAVAAALLSVWSGESMLRLVGSTCSATLLALVTAFAVATATGASPSVVAFSVAVLVLGAALIPPLSGLPPVFPLSPGPLGWLRGEPPQAVFLAHDAAVAGVAAVILAGVLSLPRDVRGLRWVSSFRGQDA